MQGKTQKKVIAFAAVLAVLAGAACSPAVEEAAENNRGVIRGTVQSADGGSLYGIMVSARGAESNYATSVFTDEGGEYEFPPLPAGSYQISVGTEWQETVSLTASGVSQDFSAQLGPGFLNQTTGVSWAQVLPGTEEEKARFSKSCGNCHTVWRVMGSSPRSPQEWAGIMKRDAGVDSVGGRLDPGQPLRIDLSPENVKAVTQYLAKVIQPEVIGKYAAEAMVRPTGEAARAVFTEWDMPTQGEILTTSWTWADPQGNIWYTAPGGNVIGKLDPLANEFQEWPYTMPGSLYHDLVGDQEGNLWLPLATDDKLIKFDTATHKYAEWGIPGKHGRRPHMGDIDPDGNFWVTLNRDVEGIEAVVKLDPRTGVVTEYPQPGKRPHNYDIDVDQEGNVWFTELGAHKVGKIDRTGKLTEYTVPTPNAGPRGIEADSKGNVWFTEYHADQLGVLDSSTGKITEYDYDIAGGKPYFVKVDRFDKVWFDLLNGNLLGKFDPETKKFVFFLFPTPESVPRDATFVYTTDPFSIVYGAGRKGKLGRMYVR